MTKRSRALWIGLAVCGVLAAVCAVIGCRSQRLEAKNRIGRQLGLDDVASPERVQAGLDAKLPAGTPEEAVYTFLVAGGVGKEPRSTLHRAEERPEIVADFDFDTGTLALVRESYAIVFLLDERRLLRSIEVRRFLTGL